ncbi:type III secretion system HrpP C-terminal domain-containing protein [Pantoea sp. BAV 3049]|uniref:type III secretion system HrpP C-terminal domain-containing protein n=1 Tax=Pantoea sp. BAV 3049 TaxID=2654188 RepID=UPI00131EB49F|nr:type III secretion system HrpP C-terminal domain-containing protein [Pantoea sp. BAV 3049]
MIRNLSQAALQHQLQQATERQTQQKRDTQRHARSQFLQARDARNRDNRGALPPQPDRTRPAAAITNTSPRFEPRRPTREEDDLFSSLLDSDDVMSPLLAFNDAGSDQQQGFSQLEESVGSAPPAMAMWQEIEPALADAMSSQPPGEMQLTLILPKLGHVDAWMSALPAGGWDIALHLQPAAWQALLPHQERCRFSLRQRMACRVRLRFERREQGERQEPDS